MTITRSLAAVFSLALLTPLVLLPGASPAAASLPASTTALTVASSTAAPAVSVLPAQTYNPTVEKVEQALHRLKLPVGTVDGKFDGETQKGICAWRALTGKDESRYKLTEEERAELFANDVSAAPRSSLMVPKKFVVGVNISKTCQTLFWVKKNEDGDRKLRGVFKVSTGTSGHTTPSGTYRVNRQINGWHESTKYAGAMMYRPKYFNGGIAMHGSITDSYVLPYPASHGCVRMLHRDIDTLWRAGVNPGTTVRVYGEWGQ